MHSFSPAQLSLSLVHIILSSGCIPISKTSENHIDRKQTDICHAFQKTSSLILLQKPNILQCTKKLIRIPKINSTICLTHLLMLIKWSVSSGDFIILPRSGKLNERQTSLTSGHKKINNFQQNLG